LGINRGPVPSHTAIKLFVVPKSIPTIIPTLIFSVFC
jgi:hypothetical protein